MTVKSDGYFGPDLPDVVRINVDTIEDVEFVGESATVGEMMAPVAKATAETDEEVIARIGERFDILDQMTKATIAGALGYFIVPLDAIADITPAVGYADDLGVLALAIAAVAAYINDDVRRKTADKLEAWFGSDDDSPE